MKRFSMLQPLYLSFYSRELYRDVRRNWKGTGFLYLLVLLALTWLPVIAKLHGVISNHIREEAPRYIEQVPMITIAKGQVSIDRPVPYTIKDPATGTPLMVIDTSGRISSIEEANAPMLLTRDRFIYRQPNRAETRIYDLAAIDELTITRGDVSAWVEAFRKYFAVLAYPVALAGSFLYRILQALLYAAIGMLFVNAMKAGFDYAVMLRLTAVAITPAVILSTLRTVAGFAVPVFPLVSFAIAMGYLYFAVKANAGQAASGASEP